MSNFIKEWTHKEVEVLTRSFRRYSAYVFILKFVLPITALVMAAILFVYPAINNNGKKIVLVAHDNITPGQANPTMDKPKFIGRDSKNQPYQLTSKQAVQQTPTFLTMKEVAGDITLKNGNWVSVVADRGDYNSTTHQVNLYDDVNSYLVPLEGGIYQGHTKNAFIDMDSGIMKSNDPVYIRSDTNSLKAQSFILDREKQKISFKGPVRVVIVKQQ